MKKILVIEDDRNIAQGLQIRLAAAGYQVQTAFNGVDGLTLARDQNPDLVMLDLSMPVGAGESVAYRLRQGSPQTPFIFLTARKDQAARRAADQLCAAGFFEKPYDATELLAGISRVLDEHGGTESLPPLPRPASLVPSANPALKKLLIIEDDEKIAAALAIRLKAAGFQTFVSYDAVTGLVAAVRERPHLVLLDISLPGGNGFALAERIQTSIPTPTPIIFLTASKQPELRQRAAALGAAGFFEKPYDSEKLLAAIKSALLQAT